MNLVGTFWIEKKNSNSDYADDGSAMVIIGIQHDQFNVLQTLSIMYANGEIHEYNRKNWDVDQILKDIFQFREMI